ncbi:DUF1844 domain-containing protein [Polyangium mundeleinium]|uniref:DUF1844 domain-containing protein n=1 Tax=Polyangium mundeleinium TaxID=2995306 RepID=A0ABT5F539_9BACT|nr:DUF1844 domain-containing protein [Polyangium mundeleinium]MDC0748533.1 DUF1844 domain-containing protein [Polyangium mundeleinium]
MSSPDDRDAPPPGQLPKLDFSIFVMSIIGSAHVHLGDMPGPDGHSERSLDLAQQNIELLTLLEEKTKGNLTGEEERLLTQALDELRERLAEVSKET